MAAKNFPSEAPKEESFWWEKDETAKYSLEFETRERDPEQDQDCPEGAIMLLTYHVPKGKERVLIAKKAADPDNWAMVKAALAKETQYRLRLRVSVDPKKVIAAGIILLMPAENELEDWQRTEANIEEARKKGYAMLYIGDVIRLAEDRKHKNPRADTFEMFTALMEGKGKPVIDRMLEVQQ